MRAAPSMRQGHSAGAPPRRSACSSAGRPAVLSPLRPVSSSCLHVPEGRAALGDCDGEICVCVQRSISTVWCWTIDPSDVTSTGASRRAASLGVAALEGRCPLAPPSCSCLPFSRIAIVSGRPEFHSVLSLCSDESTRHRNGQGDYHLHALQTS